MSVRCRQAGTIGAAFAALGIEDASWQAQTAAEASSVSWAGRGPLQRVSQRNLTDDLERGAEERIEVLAEGLVFFDGGLDGLLRGGPLIAEVGQRGEHILGGWAS